MILGSKTISLGLSFWVSKGGEKLSKRLFFRCSGSSPWLHQTSPVCLFPQSLSSVGRCLHRGSGDRPRRPLRATEDYFFRGFQSLSRSFLWGCKRGNPHRICVGGERPRSSRRPARPPGCPSVLSRARMPHLLQGEKEELLGQQLRVQQQLGVRAAATAHIPRHGRRQETPAGYPQDTAAEASRK